MCYSAIHNGTYVTYRLRSVPCAQRVEPFIVGCCCLSLLAWLIGCTYVVSKWFSLVQWVLILCVRWFRTGAVYMPGGAMSVVSCSGSLSDPWAPPPPLPILSMQADQDWWEGLWQWIHLSLVFVCVYNDHWNCWSEKCKKRYAWLQVSGDKTHRLYLYLHWNCSSCVFLPAHIFSYLYLCVCRDNIPHRE